MELFCAALCASEILHCTVSHQLLKANLILLAHFVPANKTCFKNVPFLRKPFFILVTNTESKVMKAIKSAIVKAASWMLARHLRPNVDRMRPDKLFIPTCRTVWKKIAVHKHKQQQTFFFKYYGSYLIIIKCYHLALKTDILLQLCFLLLSVDIKAHPSIFYHVFYKFHDTFFLLWGGSTSICSCYVPSVKFYNSFWPNSQRPFLHFVLSSGFRVLIT